MLNLSNAKPSYKRHTSTARPSSQVSKPSLKQSSINSKSSVKSMSLSRLDSEFCLTSKIETSVSNIKQKIQELNSLKLSLKEKSSESSEQNFSSRIQSREMGKLSKNRALLNGYLNKSNNPKPVSWDIESKIAETKKFEFKPGFDRIMFESEHAPKNENQSIEAEIKDLKSALKAKEDQLIYSENLRKLQEIQLAEKDKAHEELNKVYIELLETNCYLSSLVPKVQNNGRTKTQILRYQSNYCKIKDSKDISSKDTNDSVISKLEITQKSIQEFDSTLSRSQKNKVLGQHPADTGLLSLIKYKSQI